MSATTRLKAIVRSEDAQLDATICRRTGIDVDTYKALRFAFRVVGFAVVAAGWLIPRVDPHPMVLLVLAAFVLGPDIVEEYLTRGGGDG